MEFRIAEKIKLSAQVSLILVLNALSFNLSAQPSVGDEQVTFVRLTAEQYRNSIRDIFGDSIEITGNAIAAGVREAGLMAVGGRRLTLSSSEVESYEVLALDVASQVMSPSRRNTLIPCRPENENVFDGDCAREFISTVGFHLFRRSLSEYEIGSYSAMASKATESLGGFYIGLQAALKPGSRLAWMASACWSSTKRIQRSGPA